MVFYIVTEMRFITQSCGESTTSFMQPQPATSEHSEKRYGHDLEIQENDSTRSLGSEGDVQIDDKSHKDLRLHVEINGAQNKSVFLSSMTSNPTVNGVNLSPYEASSSFRGRKILSANYPNFAKVAAQISKNVSTTSKKSRQNNGMKNKGPADYTARWPAQRKKILAMQKKILAARKKLDVPEKALLERIEQGDELKKQASHVTNLDRLNQYDQPPNLKETDSLKKTYKDLGGAIEEVRKKVRKIEKGLSQKTVAADVKKQRLGLRKLMKFATPNVDDALASGWSKMINSLADTTNFEYSALLDKPPLPAISIYRYGDGVGERTYLNQDIDNLQRTIDSMTTETDVAPDPDLEKVEEVLSDMLNKNRVLETEKTIDDILLNKDNQDEEDVEENEADMGDEETDNHLLNDEGSTMRDGVFYLFDPRNRPREKVRHGNNVVDSFKLDRGSVTDKLNGGGYNEIIAQAQLEGPDDDEDDDGNDEDESPHIAAETQRAEHADVIQKNMRGNADSGMVTVGGTSVGDIQHNIYRKTRSADNSESYKLVGGANLASRRTKIETELKSHLKDDEVGEKGSVDIRRHLYRVARGVGDRRDVKKIAKGNVIADFNDDGLVPGDVNTVITKQRMDGNSAPKLARKKSHEDRESYNLVDDSALDRQNLQLERPMASYRVEDEVDQTGDIDYGSGVLSVDRRIPVNFDKVYKSAHQAESVEKDKDEEFEDESMEVGSVDNYGRYLDDVPFDRDRDIIRAYKTTLNILQSPRKNFLTTYPKHNRINDGLDDDTRLSPGEMVEVGDNALYGPDNRYPATGPNAGREVGSVSFWTRELAGLGATEKRNQMLADKIKRNMFREYEPTDVHREGDALFLDTSDKVRKKSYPRLSDLFAKQVKSILQETQEDKGNIVKSDRKRLVPWRYNLYAEPEISENDERERRKEDQLEALVNPELGELLKRTEAAQEGIKPDEDDFRNLNKLVASLLDDQPINPDEFDYLKNIADVSLFKKPVKVNPASARVPRPLDKDTKNALKRLDKSLKTLADIDEEMKYKQRDKLKKQLADTEKAKQELKIERATKKMMTMYDDIRAIPKLESMNEELRKKRVKQYEHMTKELQHAFDQRVKFKKSNYQRYDKLFKQIKKQKRITDKLAKHSPA